jgi:hypothetical protein
LYRPPRGKATARVWPLGGPTACGVFARIQGRESCLPARQSSLGPFGPFHLSSSGGRGRRRSWCLCHHMHESE